jgi:serralysin
MAIIDGNNLDNVMEGTSGADTISGFGGNDTLLGLGGNDLFFGRNGNDTINGGANFDTAAYFDSGSQGISANLSTGKVIDAFGDTDTLISIEGIVGTDLKDNLIGSGKADTLSGRGGNDTLDGAGGNDVLLGGAGNDVISGGAGSDTLTGGVGADTFLYLSASHSPPEALLRDTITDFKPGIDKIDVSGIDANSKLAGDQDFAFINNQAFSAAGQVRAIASGGTLLQFETTGDGVADFEIRLDDTLTLKATDFFL